ncbi:M24 family metallopeptidase [Campylobacter sp. FMV-PI01]|uniref:M24 family metallopeptidase n=1 Tax=Campylobacter portucalensis TaxID=2608384 RepID=A0A6L5WNA9_9BACT|nr:M24 family metallopeptidase [Campylobacter portucalensis]MSN97151.1 M24 family metallopeptidase [Campylobacter portucalensis]
MKSNFVLRDENSVFFECGYSCDNQIFLNLDGNKFLITDSRYAIEARNLAINTQIIETNLLFEEAKNLIDKFNIKELVFDPFDFSYGDFLSFSKDIKIFLKQEPFFSKKKRMIKSQDEIQKLKKAASLGARGFDLIADFINENANLSEKELFFEASNVLKQKGELDLSFLPIIAINQNAAKAHALPTQEILKNGDLFLMDAGVKFQRYCSDRTRTAFFDGNLNFSKAQKFKNQKQNEIYEIVKEAQNLAIKAIKPGALASDIDNVARSFIAKNGYEKAFFHSTGHGVGLDIHEFPNISKNSQTILEEGMVFSVEPGIYLENEFGVRIEDVVVVTKSGCEIL